MSVPTERPDHLPAERFESEIWPLSPPQQALWFLENFNPGSSFYVIGLGLVLRGPLDTAALWAALADTAERHEALRTRFLTLGGRPYQTFVPGQQIDGETIDLSDEPDPDGAAVAQLDQMASASFDLRAEPPMRSRLIRLATDHHVLLFAVHHIVFDGWSTQVLLTDLAAAYDARRHGRPATLPALETGVGAYAALLAARDCDGLPGDELGYWSQVLHDAPVVDLPTDFARPVCRTFEGAACGLELDAAVTAALRDLARDLGTTPFTVLAAVFTTLVARLSGHDDVVIGIPLAGRSQADTHGLVGFFANALPLRVDLSGTLSFREAIERHREPVHELLTRQHVPFARLVDALAPKRTANRNPYYDICFQYLPTADQGVSFGDLELEFLGGGTREASQFDLSCDVHDLGDRLRIQFEYSTELFTQHTVRSHLEEYARLLRQAVTEQDGARSAASAPVRAILRTADPVTGGLAGIVANQARLRPHKVAVRSAGRSLTFTELDTAAARFASLLIDCGVFPGDRVGLLVEPSVNLAIAAVGILRTGAAYVPGDVKIPAARTAETLRQADCRLLVHDVAASATVREIASEVSVSTLLLNPAKLAGYTPAPLADPDPLDPAYVIFTSGSTGRPKGVVVPHRAALSLAVAAAEVYQITSEDIVLQMASPAVDVSLEEFFGSWQAGAAVFVQGPVIDNLSELVRTEGLTVLNLPAALWHEWTRQAVAGETAVPDGLRLVITGSDRVDPQRVRQWHAGPGAGIRLLNAYGVTEAAVSSAWFDTTELEAVAAHTTQVPIGRAFPHAALYVLDESGAPVADGVPGELWIGGPGVAIGYIGDPEGTQARFRPDPFQNGPGHRMYRTGDQVRVLPSGVLDFRGRTDTQVKIRGTRIELAEVERVASEVPGVAGFVADVRPDAEGTPRLVGYLHLEASVGDDRGLGRERVDEWRQIHDAEVFNEVDGAAQADLNASGWISSYTQQPIPEAAMAEWRDEMVARIMTEPPGRVLEIGCGTGMILLCVAPSAEYYVGTDISPRALRYVADQLPGAGLVSKVRLVEGAAHDLGALGEEGFDLVVLNSVVQYFPGEEYLTEVIESAWRLLRPGGRLLIGDVRDLTLLASFHLSVQQFRQPTQDDAQEVADTVAECVETENELCLAPAYFSALAARLPGPATVEVLTKVGCAENEMNGFRYDVLLRRAADSAESEGAGLSRRDGGELTAERFAHLLEELDGQDACITGVHDARVARYEVLAHEPTAPNGRGVAASGRTASAYYGGVHPADLAALAAARGRRITLRQAGDGLLDVMLADDPPSAGSLVPARAATSAPVANCPLATAVRRATITAVREHLGHHLAKAMIPSRMVFVADFPLTTSGKVDRSRLPDPPHTENGRLGAAPRTELESLLAAAWEQVLAVNAVSVWDNFFEIGGDSIGWLQIMSRCSLAGVRLTARDVFQHQTIAALASAVETRRAAQLEPSGGTVSGAAPGAAGLTPIQHWFMEAFPVGRDRQNQSQWYELAEGCPADVLRHALHDVVTYHQALTSIRFARDGDSWAQHAGPPKRTSLPLTEVSLPAAGPLRDQALADADNRAQAGLSVTDGPLFAMVVFRTPAGEPDLIEWCVHHLVVDAISWQFLSEDLEAAIDARRRGKVPALPPPTASFLEWSSWSQEAAERMDAPERAYWRAAASARPLALPLRHPEAEALYGTAHRVRRLIPVPKAATGQLPGGLMTAAALVGVRAALGPVVGTSSGVIWLEFHGRPLDGYGPDITRTVGWFTALFPFELADLDPAGLRARLAAVPGSGIGYGRARFLGGEKLSCAANVVVNYLGAAGGTAAGRHLCTVARPDTAGPDVAADAPMPFALEVNLAQESNGTLVLECVCGDQYVDVEEASDLVDALAAEIAAAFAALPEMASTAGAAPAVDAAGRAPDLSLLPAAVRSSAGFASLLRRTGPLDAVYPLTPMQQMMLNRHLLEPKGDANYNESVLTLEGELDPGLFEVAWRALVQRHEALRTSVEWTGLPQPLQVVHGEAPSALRIIDWSGLSAARVQRRLVQLLGEERAAPPPLSGLPPFRLTLVKTEPRGSRLVWIDHHILLDGWSSAALVTELMECYAQLAAGKPPFAEAPPPVPYRDYVRWTHGRTDAETPERWRDALAGFTAPTQLPFDADPPAVAATTEDYRETSRELSAELYDTLRRAARERRTTLSSVLAAAWAAFLHRLTGDPQVCFGMALNGRPAQLGEVTSMFGLYLTTLPLVVRVEDRGLTAGQLLDTVTRQCWQLADVSATSSLWDVYNWTGIPVSRTLFQSVLVVQNFSSAASPRTGAALPLTVRTAHSRLVTGAPLTVAVDTEDGVRLIWDSRSFASSTADRILDGFVAMLPHIAGDRDRLVAHLPTQEFAPQPVGDPRKSVRHDGALTPPQGPIEAQIAQAWHDVLGTRHVGRHLNLFEAGANSVAVMRLHARLSEMYGTHIALLDLFRFPTVAAMASLIGTPGDRDAAVLADAHRTRSQRRRAALTQPAADRRRSRSRAPGPTDPLA